MNPRFAILPALGLFVAGCSHLSPADDPARAIALADRACHESWGKDAEQNGQTWHVDPKSWHARLDGDHWKVWTGNEDNPVLSINVPLDGRLPDAGSCALRFDD